MSPVILIKETRTRGFKAAWASFKRRRHLWPLLAYLFLTFWIGYTFAIERQHSNHNRNALAAQTHTVLVAGCERQNQLRKTLQQILLSGIPATRKLVEEGTITQFQFDRAIANTRRQVKLLKPVNCVKAYPTLQQKD